MTDINDLVKRLRRADEYEPLGHDGWESADVIEAQAKEIAELKSELVSCRKGNDSYHDENISLYNQLCDFSNLAKDFRDKNWPQNIGWYPPNDTAGIIEQINSMYDVMNNRIAELEMIIFSSVDDLQNGKTQKAFDSLWSQADLIKARTILNKQE